MREWGKERVEGKEMISVPPRKLDLEPCGTVSQLQRALAASQDIFQKHYSKSKSREPHCLKIWLSESGLGYAGH